MLKKQLILLAVAVLLFVGFFFLPRNREWAQKITSYYHDFPSEKKRLARETRMRDRFGSSYILSKSIADQLRKKGADSSALVLVPPPYYFAKRGVYYPMPEPAVFYYFTNIKTTWCHFTNAPEANWYVKLDSGKVVVDRVVDTKSLRDTIASFLKWKLPNE
jgi:hypothetical protein